MKKPNIREGKGPEAKIQKAIIILLESKGWFVKPTHGNLYQSGFPDLYCIHTAHKQRWIEVKNPLSYRFTIAQLGDFPKISKGTGIWIMTAASESEYSKLFARPNWHLYLN